MKKAKESEKRPYKVVLPKNSISPTNSIYKTHDILSQGRALWHIENGRTLRSAMPFSVSVMVNGKVKILNSVMEN